MKKNQKVCCITEDELYTLIKDSLILNALENGGVDNWTWCSESLYDFAKDACDLREDDDERPLDAIERVAMESTKSYFKEIKEGIDEKTTNNLDDLISNVFL